MTRISLPVRPGVELLEKTINEREKEYEKGKDKFKKESRAKKKEKGKRKEERGKEKERRKERRIKSRKETKSKYKGVDSIKTRHPFHRLTDELHDEPMENK